MPVYLVHGFRWPREGFTGIRVHAVLHNLDDCSVEYIQNSNSREEILRSFREIYPEIMKELDHTDVNPAATRRLEFIEQYNPDDLEGPYAVSQPYAFVGDKVVVIAAGPGMGLAGPGVAQAKAYHHVATEVDPAQSPQKKQRATTLPMSKPAPFNSPADTTALSVNLDEVVADGPGLTNKAWEALADLRDKIAEGEKIGWWVVYNGDPERSFDDAEDDEDEQEDEEMEDVAEEDEDREQKETITPVASPVASPISPPPPVAAAAASAFTPSKRGHRPTPSDSLPIPTSTMTNYPTSNPSVAPTHVASQHIASQQKQQQSPQQPQLQYQDGGSPGLTALPVRPTPPSSTGPGTRPNTASAASEASKGKHREKEKDLLEDPTRAKDASRPQGLRKKFFGRRT
ncbi:hypothetical protein AYO21_05987 [Fonsecaea monophora]|uniref:Uncharacterized protein n=1 Tax=Fonsecaea monophora TaxID=254056 RepID=A0A177F8F0_9EURO|nr:hypothetical protein AYO21_05987 [Fonsecaea monophora]OAG39712.1 hypothetical protein AYO21_05987 [Fonsecaea monophora]